MSQFFFGEVLFQEEKSFDDIPVVGIDSYPFVLRFQLSQFDFYRRMAPLEYHVIPFVISDSTLDNTAELVLRSDSISYEAVQGLEPYAGLLALSASERMNMISEAIREVLLQLGSKECILVLCDGDMDEFGYTHCAINDLAKTMKRLLDNNAYCTVANYWVNV